jgi:hypothetical protein
MPRAKFDQDRRRIMTKYGSFEKYVLAKLHRYNLLDHVYIITASTLVPGGHKYAWMDTTHSCKEIMAVMPGVLRAVAPDAVFLAHDMRDKSSLKCLMAATQRDKVQLMVGSIAVI